MRLTLRTLLAWLDDTLSPGEVREIGKQVNESPVAKELVERIHRVTRQRRLTVPSQKGPDAVDPNVVAGYLDNELDPDAVAEFEKRCLTSDVHLAEVASVHQILSLIGQKAKVPAEARHRMYHLVKGREAVNSVAPRASRQSTPRMAPEPVQPWITAPPPSSSWVERFGPAAAVLGLIVVMVWSAWMSLSPAERSGRSTASRNAAKNRPAPADSKTEADALALAASRDAQARAAAEKEARAKQDEAARAAEKDQAKPETVAADIPPGSAGFAKKPSGVLMRYNAERRDWDRLTDATPLREQDRLLSLAPFRASVEIGKANVDLVDETEIWVRSTPTTQAARLSLAQGKVVLLGTNPPLPFEVAYGSQTVTITPPSDVRVGVERINLREPGQPVASPSVLRIFAADGPVKIAEGSAEDTIETSGAVTVDSDGKFSDHSTNPPPDWVTETEPKPFDQSVGEAFLKFFRPNRPAVIGLVEASEDDQKDVCRVAISGLRALGDISFIVPLLKTKGSPTAQTVRKSAIAVLRSYLAQGPEAAKTLRDQLREVFGEDLAATTEKLLVGYTPKEAGEEATYTKLINLMATTDDAEVGIRELALDNLQQITGRDSLGYDPEKTKPETKALKDWRDLLKGHELRPAGAIKAAR